MAPRFIVFGAGAVGGVAGARLFEAGHDVTLVARGAHREAIAAHGLTLRSPAGSVTLQIPVVADVAAAGARDDDVVLLAVKSQHTQAALSALRDTGAAPAVVCLQNGVANERAALRLFERVYGVVVMCPTTHLKPGVVDACSAPVTGILDVGRAPRGVDDTARALAAALSASTFVSEPRADIMRWKWRKLIMNLGNAVQALCARDTPERASAADALVARARAEGEAALRAAGVDAVSDAEDKARRGSLLRVQPIDGEPRAGGSTWQSLARGAHSIETDWLSGEVVLLGRLHDVPTPANALLVRLAADAARRGAAPGALDAAELLRALP